MFGSEGEGSRSRSGSVARWLLPLALLTAWGCSGEDDSTGEGDDTAAMTDLGYCDIVPILDESCRRCHTDPPVHGAPFPLATYEEVQAKAARMHHAVETDYMPYQGIALEPPVESLSSADKTNLLEWLAADAPRGEGECGP